MFFGVLVALGYALIESGQQVTDDDADASGASGTSVNSRERRAVVLRAVDGDTILVRILGSGDRPTSRTERVRYVGVDTPESVKPGTPVECFGKDAAEFNKHLVDGRRVRLVPDREALDRYGRTLAFVYVRDTFVNAELVRRGYARTMEIEPNTSKAEQFALLERVAIRTNRGLWGACDR